MCVYILLLAYFFCILVQQNDLECFLTSVSIAAMQKIVIIPNAVTRKEFQTKGL